MKKKNRILVAMSGGIDSSLAAAILKDKGHAVIGATMKLWPKEDCGLNENAKACCSLSGIEDARHVAARIGIPHYVFNFDKEFRREVIDHFCSEYSRGYTPNPCITCNQKIKFRLLLNKAKALDCEYIATGHYAKVGYSGSQRRYFIGEGRDKTKDQSYFLSFISQADLSRTMFPLENMTKGEARKLASEMRLRVHDKKSSQEVCFVRGHYSEYIKSHGGSDIRGGDIINSSGRKIGHHKGIHNYTIGQRKGLGIAHSEPLYVINIDPAKNTITAGVRQKAFKRAIIAKDPVWGLLKKITKPVRVMCKIRYAHKSAEAVIRNSEKNRIRIDFKEPQIAPTPGQAAVFYKNGRVLGGAWIEKVIA